LDHVRNPGQMSKSLRAMLLWALFVASMAGG
jgi:hypothetical protein